MLNELKPFGAKVTAFINDVIRPLDGKFHEARVRLTILYCALLAVILILSSFVIFSSFSDRLERRFNVIRSTPTQFRKLEVPQPEFAIQVAGPTPEQVRTDLISTLLIANSLLLLGAGFLSYWLAGLTLQPIQAAYDNQRRFLSDASHELRTPLAILRTELENELGNTTIPPKQKAQAESHLEEVDRMTSLVNDLLAVSRQDDSVTIEQRIETTNLNTLITQTIERLDSYAAPLHIQLTAHLPKIPIKLAINAAALDHALTNLIKNGIDYNKPNGSVTVRLKKQPTYIQITVSDTGIGIPKSDLANIFDRFYRVENSRSRTSGGHGLGLSIVKQIIENHNGTIDIDSTLGVGTTICLQFPVPS
jgi:signal transduction histidine kinase